ncbi:MAG: carboxypeptidase regulatory-like domain-containing protein [Candidatus Hydrogenedentes bacterium]|nr:carboxypeptidase regulatory-like domain-containing protein [Candidatus Hydrogenedentota bacterium]
MKSNTRFYVMLGVMLAVVASMYLLVRREPESKTPAEENTPVQRADESGEKSTAPELTSSRRASRLAPVSTRTAAPPSIPGHGKSGVHAITGLVVLESDQSPVANASVLVYYVNEGDYFAEFNGAAAWKASTNGEGLFRVAGLPASRYVIAVSKGELGGVQETGIDPRDLEDTTATIELRPVGFIAGHVRNEAGDPLPVAFVVLGRGKRDGVDVYGYSQCTAEADGSFKLEYVPEGIWSVRAQTDGYTYADTNNIALNAEDAVIVLKRGGSLSGVAVDASAEKPIAGVEVYAAGKAYTDGYLSERAASDANGSFTLRDLADGEYQLRLYKGPYVLANERKPFIIRNANHVTDLELRVLRGGVITGRATDAVTGAPIAGMEFSSEGATQAKAVTDNDGVYRLEGLSSGSYMVKREWMPGYRHGEDRENKSAAVELGKETTGVDFAVPPGLNLSGRVVDENGAPLAMVRVTSETNETREGESTRSDANGRWVHRGFSPGAVAKVSAQKTGYFAEAIENVTIPEQGRSGVEIVMKLGGTISGVVVEQTGAFIKQTPVTATPAEINGAEPRRGWSRDDGAFTINGLSPGTYKLTARPQNTYTKQSSRETEVTVAKGERVTDVRVVVDLDAGMKIAGRVLDVSGQPIEGAGINVSAPDKDVSGNARTDADGHFEIVGLEAGEYRVFAHQEKYSRVESKAIAPDTNVTITLRGKATIEGRVVDARSGGPINSFELSVRNGDETTIDPASRISGGRPFVDEEGQFKVTADEGANTICVQAPGYAPTARLVPDLRADQTTSGIEIRLEPGGVVEGTVTNGRGEPVAAANIWINHAPQQAWESRHRAAAATTDTNGHFRIDSLSQTEITLIAVHADYLPEQVVVQPSRGRGTSVSLVLGTGGGLEGIVRLGGKPAAEYGVHISAGQPLGSLQNDTKVGEDGSYGFPSLPPGDVQLQVYGNLKNGANRSTQRRATIQDNQVTILDIDIEGGSARIEGIVTREGQPLAGASVHVFVPRDNDMHESAEVRTDAKGIYKVIDLPPGPATVSISAPGSGQSKSEEVALENGRVARLNTDFADAAPVRVLLNGVSSQVPVHVTLYRGQVDLTNSEGNFGVRGEQAVGTSAGFRDGSFKFESVEVGDYTIVAVAQEPGENNALVKFAMEAVTVRKNEQLNVELTLR